MKVIHYLRYTWVNWIREMLKQFMSYGLTSKQHISCCRINHRIIWDGIKLNVLLKHEMKSMLYSTRALTIHVCRRRKRNRHGLHLIISLASQSTDPGSSLNATVKTFIIGIDYSFVNYQVSKMNNDKGGSGDMS